MSFFKYLGATALTVALLLGGFRANVERLKIQQHSAMHWIISVDRKDGKAERGAGCTAYAVGPHTLLTAQHCDIGADKVYIDSNKDDAKNDVATSYQIVSKTFDGQDHMLLDLRGANFYYTISVQAHTRAPHQREPIYFWGNPTGNLNQFHIGYMMGTIPWETSMGEDPDLNAKGPLYLAASAGAPGDSGSVVFSDWDGHVIGVLSLGGFYDGGVIGIFPLQFTQAQINAAMKN